MLPLRAVPVRPTPEIIAAPDPVAIKKNCPVPRATSRLLA
jgi:hypothetical protein